MIFVEKLNEPEAEVK